MSGIVDLGQVDTANIDGGTIDGTTIGSNNPAAGSFTDLTATGTVTVETKGTADYVVATSDSTAAMRAIADYLGDGTADDVQIEAALANAGTIYIAGGTYDITNEISVLSNTYLIMSPQAALKMEVTALTEFRMLHLNTCSNVVIEGGIIDGNQANQTVTHASDMHYGIAAYTSSNIRIENVTVQNIGHASADSGYGIYFNNVDDSRVHNSLLSGCKRENMVLYNGSENNVVSDMVAQDSLNRSYVVHSADNNIFINCLSLDSTHQGFDIQASDNILIKDCTVKNSGSGAGIYLRQAADSAVDCQDCSITGTTIISPTGYGIWLYQADDTSVEGCVVEGSSDDSYNVSSSSLYTHFDGCISRNAGDFGFLTEANNTYFKGCYVYNSTDHGLYISHSSDCDIVGCSIDSTGGNGVMIVGSDHVLINGCSIDSTTLDGIHTQSTCSFLTISGNTIQDTAATRQGMELTATTDSLIAGNTVLNAGDNAIDLDSTSHRCAITGNFINNYPSPDCGIYLESDDCVVSGNNIKDPGGTGNQGIYVLGDDNLITGNNCEDTSDAGHEIRNTGSGNVIRANIGTVTGVSYRSTHMYLWYDSSSNTTDGYQQMQSSAGSNFSATRGFVMPYDGCVISHSIQTIFSTETDTNQVEFMVYKNGIDLGCDVVFTGDGTASEEKAYQIWSAGTYEFSAGDVLSIYANEIGTMAWDETAGWLEVQFYD